MHGWMKRAISYKLSTSNRLPQGEEGSSAATSEPAVLALSEEERDRKVDGDLILPPDRQRALQLLVQWREQVYARVCLLVGAQTTPSAHVVDKVFQGHVLRALVVLLLTVREGPLANIDLQTCVSRD
jgi:hypothetical protein